MPQKRVLGYCHSQMVQSKINLFRKLTNVKGESPATTKKLPATVSKASKARSVPGNAVSIRASSVTAAATFVNTQSVSTMSRNTLVRPLLEASTVKPRALGNRALAGPLPMLQSEKGPLKKTHCDQNGFSLLSIPIPSSGHKER